MLSSVLVLFFHIGCVLGQVPECTTLDGGAGRCKSIGQCPQLLNKVDTLRQNKVPTHLVPTLQGELFESRSRCNGGEEWTVCCSECRIPDGTSGIIKNLRECSHLWNMLIQNTTASLSYVMASRINPQTLDVCCGVPPVRRRQPSHNCDRQTDLPPDPKTMCCGIDLSSDNKIAGGKVTGIYDYPWTVIIEYDKIGSSGLESTCGGSLISNRIVVTAAHCTFSSAYNTLPKRVRVGEYDMLHEGKDCQDFPDGKEECTDGAETIPIESILRHDNYSITGYYNDIALIRLRRPVRYTDFVRPICLPSFDSSLRTGPPFRIAGWGKTSKKTTQSRYKQAVAVNFVNQQACQNAIKYSDWGADYPRLWENQICAGGEIGKDSCDGDSGGPLMAEVDTGELHFELAGVVSFGPADCGTRGVPGVYTNVYKYIDWIHQNVRQESPLWFKP